MNIRVLAIVTSFLFFLSAGVTKAVEFWRADVRINEINASVVVTGEGEQEITSFSCELEAENGGDDDAYGAQIVILIPPEVKINKFEISNNYDGVNDLAEANKLEGGTVKEQIIKRITDEVAIDYSSKVTCQESNPETLSSQMQNSHAVCSVGNLSTKAIFSIKLVGNVIDTKEFNSRCSTFIYSGTPDNVMKNNYKASN